MSQVPDFVTLLLSFASLVAATLAVRFSLERLTDGDHGWSRWGALLVPVMGYFHYLLEFGHPCCTPMQLPYDLPSLAFFAICFALIVADRMVWLFPVFALATLNRESTLFLIVVLVLYRSADMQAAGIRARRTWETAGQIAGLIAVWAGLRLLLHTIFHPAPPIGPVLAGFEIHVFDNMGYLLRPYYWTSFLSLFGFTWLFVYANWRQVPGRRMRRVLWIGPIYLAAMFVVGVLSEIRVFGELIPIYTVAFTLLLRRLWQERSHPGLALG